jgi:hypothetical protein
MPKRITKSAPPAPRFAGQAKATPFRRGRLLARRLRPKTFEIMNIEQRILNRRCEATARASKFDISQFDILRFRNKTHDCTP